jgi:hypothetical protein
VNEVNEMNAGQGRREKPKTEQEEAEDLEAAFHKVSVEQTKIGQPKIGQEVEDLKVGAQDLLKSAPSPQPTLVHEAHESAKSQEIAMQRKELAVAIDVRPDLE